jgi:uncharacterized protein DUF6924
MPELPARHLSLLVRTDFASDNAWRELRDQALREYDEGFRAYLEPASDPAFGGFPWETVKAAVPANAHGAPVLFIADRPALANVGLGGFRGRGGRKRRIPRLPSLNHKSLGRRRHVECAAV